MHLDSWRDNMQVQCKKHCTGLINDHTPHAMEVISVASTKEQQSINIVTLKTKNMLNSNTLSTGNPSQLTQLVGLQNEVPQFKYLQNEATLQHEVPQLEYLQHEANQLVKPQIDLTQLVELRNEATQLNSKMITYFPAKMLNLVLSQKGLVSK